MGADFSHKRAPMGCFFVHRNPTGIALDGIAGITKFDCDCHAQEKCYKGEPPAPDNIQEWKNDKKLRAKLVTWNSKWRDKIKDSPGRKHSNDHTYKQPPEETKIPNGKRMVKRTVQVGNDNAWALALEARRAFDALPEHKQTTILNRWDAFSPFVRRSSSASLARGGLGKLDPRPTLAVVLADPRKGGNIVINMDKQMANLFRFCASKAIDDVLDKLEKQHNATQRHLIKAKNDGEQQVSAEDEKKARAEKEVDEIRVAYHNAIVRYADLWKEHTPQGLDHDYDAQTPFALYNGDNSTAALYRRTSPSTADDICRSVHEWASNEATLSPNSSCLARPEEGIASLMWQLDLNEHHPSLDAVGIPVSNITAVDGLSWSANSLEQAFGATYPAVQVGLNYFASSLWTGLASY
ncbi:hypothetical protein G7046_g9254 [Stylonectria norvegica]|nr:hypothetical protein G7046_g9254 [Stylonectria norvegica]